MMNMSINILLNSQLQLSFRKAIVFFCLLFMSSLFYFVLYLFEYENVPKIKHSGHMIYCVRGWK